MTDFRLCQTVVIFLSSVVVVVVAATSEDSFEAPTGCYTQEFQYPFEDFRSNASSTQKSFLFQNTNLENFYVAFQSDQNCTKLEGGKGHPNIMLISDDRGCGALVRHNPLKIEFSTKFAETAKFFWLDHYTYRGNVFFRAYDNDHQLINSSQSSGNGLLLPARKLVHSSFELENGLSAFEYSTSDEETAVYLESSIALHSLTLCFEESSAPGHKGAVSSEGASASSSLWFLLLIPAIALLALSVFLIYRKFFRKPPVLNVDGLVHEIFDETRSDVQLFVNMR